ALDAIPRNAPFRMASVGYTFIPNIAALYEVEDVRGYEAMTFRRLFDTSSLWCVPQPVWYNRIDDPTRPFLSFLNVRYFLLPPGHPPPPKWKVLFSGAEGQLVENPRALPRAFVPRSLRYATDRAETLKLLEGIGDFAGAGIVEESPPPEAAGAVEINGQATVEIASYEPQRMTLDITAAGPSLVATSVTAWPGWKLTIDDEPAKLVGYNSA